MSTSKAATSSTTTATTTTSGAAERQQELQKLESILKEKRDPRDQDGIREQEQAIQRLGVLFKQAHDSKSLAELVRSNLPFLSTISKAKTENIIRGLVAHFNDIPGARPLQIELLKELIEWSKTEKRIFLKQNLEETLASLYIDSTQYRDSLTLIDSLLREIKRLDDKMILTRVHLLESQVNYLLSNQPKAKAALTSARTAANAIYCPPKLQARLDLQSGILHAEDRDYTTAYSYFFESLEGLAAAEDPRAVASLKYMLLCKIMLSLPEDVKSIASSKLAQKYAGRDVDAMKAVAKAHEERSLADFERTSKEFKTELSEDPIIRNHLAALFDKLLEQNLLRIIEPYSRVQLQYVAEEVRQPLREVEDKLSQMILDRVFHGILDQGKGSLIVYPAPRDEETYPLATKILVSLGEVVDALGQKRLQLGVRA